MLLKTGRMILACMALSLLAMPSYAQDAAQPPTDDRPTVTLAYKYVPGELLRYKMVMQMTINMEMSGKSSGEKMNIKPTMKSIYIIRERAKSVQPNGDAEIIFTIESIRMEMMGKTMNMPTAKLPVMNIIMAPTGEIKSIKGLETLAGTGMENLNLNGSNQFSALFPSGVVHIGDTWSQSVPMPFKVGTGDMKIDNQLVSTNTKVGDYTVAKINQTFSGDFSTSIPVPAHDGIPATTVTSAGNISGDTIVYFSQIKGRLIKSNAMLKIHMKVDPSSFPQGRTVSANASMAINMDMVLLPPTGK